MSLWYLTRRMNLNIENAQFNHKQTFLITFWLKAVNKFDCIRSKKKMDVIIITFRQLFNKPKFIQTANWWKSVREDNTQYSTKEENMKKSPQIVHKYHFAWFWRTHSVHPSSPTKFSKRGSLTGSPFLEEGVAGKERSDFFQGVGVQFLNKKIN